MKDSNSDGLEELLFNMASNAAEWGQRNPDMDVNVERMFSREIAKDYVEQLTAYINEVEAEARIDQMELVDQRLIGKDAGGDRVFHDKEAVIAENRLKAQQRVISDAMKAEQRTKAKKLIGEG